MCIYLDVHHWSGGEVGVHSILCWCRIVPRILIYVSYSFVPLRVSWEIVQEIGLLWHCYFDHGVFCTVALLWLLLRLSAQAHLFILSCALRNYNNCSFTLG